MRRPTLQHCIRIALGVVVMCFVSNVYLCSRSGPSSAELADEEHFHRLMAERKPQGQLPPLPHRKLTNVLPRRPPRHVNLYDLQGSRSEYNEPSCIETKTSPSFHICLYPPEVDRYISAALLNDGIWEPYITPILQRALNKYPDAHFIDIGANIGYYSLLAAKMSHNVIAVEPAFQSILRLHKGAELSKTTQRIQLVFNAVSDHHENVSLTQNEDNQGGIWIQSMPEGRGEEDRKWTGQDVVMTTTMDHLLEVADFTQAILKIDIGIPILGFQLPSMNLLWGIGMESISIDAHQRLISASIRNMDPREIECKPWTANKSTYMRSAFSVYINNKGFECLAMAGAHRLLASVYVPYIFMEWKKMFQGLHQESSPCPQAAVEGLTRHLVALGYVPYEVRTGFQLNPDRSATRWRIGDIYWRLKDAKVLQDPF